MNPADRAAVEAAQYNARAASRDAKNLIDAGSENARMFVDKAQQQLAQGVAVLGKTGNLSAEENAAIVSGIAPGAEMSEETLAYRKSLEDEAASLREVLASASPDSPRGHSPEYLAALERLPNIEQNLSTLKAAEGVPVVQAPEAMLHASGSDLLTLVNTRDMFERDKRTIMRNAQQQATTMMMEGANYDEQAGYARETAGWNSFNTILGYGLKIAGMFIGL